MSEAERIFEEDVAANRRLGAHGAELVPVGARILTHCNAGGLATAGYGTALGIVRGAVEAGRRPFVWVDETRPVLQGARLTAWELAREGIPHAVIADVAAASTMARGEVDLVVVGADRIARERGHRQQDRDVRRGGPGASPRDPVLRRRALLDHRFRDPRRLGHSHRGAGPPRGPGAGRPAHRRRRRRPARNPAFDVTPAALITAIVTERGIYRGPYHFGG